MENILNNQWKKDVTELYQADNKLQNTVVETSRYRRHTQGKLPVYETKCDYCKDVTEDEQYLIDTYNWLWQKRHAWTL